MASALIRSHRLDGMDRRGVINLLGPPTRSTPRQDGELVYLLGPEAGPFVIDHTWLVIALDDRGRVRAAVVIED